MFFSPSFPVQEDETKMDGSKQKFDHNHILFLHSKFWNLFLKIHLPIEHEDGKFCEITDLAKQGFFKGASDRLEIKSNPNPSWQQAKF